MKCELTFNDNTVFKKNLAIQEIKTNEGIIISRADLKDDSIYYLENPVSFKIWQLINGNNSLKKIKQELLSEYDVSDNDLDRDLKTFIKDLYIKKIVTT